MFDPPCARVKLCLPPPGREPHNAEPRQAIRFDLSLRTNRRYKASMFQTIPTLEGGCGVMAAPVPPANANP